MARIDHTNCTHPRTPAGRRACRAGNAAPVVTAPVVIGQPYVMIPENYAGTSRQWHAKTDDQRAAWIAANPEIKMTGATARKLARHAAAADRVRAPRQTAAPARIQPRRSGARVAARSSACVQAALHTSGRCACGWHAANFCNTAVYACTDH